MARPKVAFQCQSCAATLSKWAGQCPDCGEWNTVQEIAAPAGPVSRRGGGYAGAGSSKVVRLGEVSAEEAVRHPTGMGELDRVLGGGVVPGSVILIGGDPGIGKSTLLLQVLAAMRERLRCLYVTGEESLQQVGLRAQRLGLKAAELRCATETRVEAVLELAASERPGLMVVDSIQTLYTDQLSSAPGSVSQVRESAAGLVRYAKANDCAVFLVGHVTKEGALAGPRILEHMVDAVLYFESDSGSRYRLIRAIKNRFGTVNEIGVFAMTGTGLKQVSSPSAIFLSGSDEPAPGSLVTVVREGTRPMLLELQALVDQSHLANPRRVALGLEHNRLAMLLAVAHRHGGVSLGDQDVFINAVGGMRITETGADLPLLLAVLSSFRARPLPRGWLSFGEVGLSGEIRPVQSGEERLKEARSHGFVRAIVPRENRPRRPIDGLEVVGVKTVSEAVDAAFG